MRDDPTVVLDPYNVHPDPADESVGLEPPLYARNIRPADVAGRDAELRELHARHARQREVVAIRNLHKRIRWALDDSVQAERALMPSALRARRGAHTELSESIDVLRERLLRAAS